MTFWMCVIAEKSLSRVCIILAAITIITNDTLLVIELDYSNPHNNGVIVLEFPDTAAARTERLVEGYLSLTPSPLSLSNVCFAYHVLKDSHCVCTET